MWASGATRRCLEPRCLVKRLQARGRIAGGSGAQDRCNQLLLNDIATMAEFSFNLARMVLSKVYTLTSGQRCLVSSVGRECGELFDAKTLREKKRSGVVRVKL